MQITMRQLQATLRDLGLFNMALAEAERDADLMAKWRKPATVIDRSDPEVERLRRHFGASSANIDLLFKKAAQKPGGPPSGALSVLKESEPPWLTLARSYLGTKEVPGRGSNGTIDGFFRDAGYPGYRDETSWCAAFVGAVLSRSGYPRLADLTARSGRYYGQKLDGPKIGCLVVFWRESPTSWKGHIGFVTGIEVADEVAWSGVTGKPSTFAPSTHSHAISEVTGLQTALDAKAPLASPALSGTPTAPTATGGTNSTQIATTAFVQAAITVVINGAPGALDTLKELADALGNDGSFATTITNSLATKLTASSNLSDLTNAATARTNLGLGTLATQAANTVAITGGTIDGVTLDGGTF